MQVISEIGKLLPSKFRFNVCGSPLSLVQELTYSIRKCATKISDKSVYPDNVSVYRVYLRAMKSEERTFEFFKCPFSVVFTEH